MNSTSRQRTLSEFMALVTKLGPSDCWEWNGRLVGRYGRFFDCRNGIHRDYVASRWIYEHLHGILDSGIQVCHKCDNPSCVNPQHLYAGTASTNALDAVRSGRHWSKAKRYLAAKGVGHGSAKLDDLQVLAIRSEISAGYTSSVVAKRYGVNKTTICRIARRVLWRHVEDSK